MMSGIQINGVEGVLGMEIDLVLVADDVEYDHDSSNSSSDILLEDWSNNSGE